MEDEVKKWKEMLAPQQTKARPPSPKRTVESSASARVVTFGELMMRLSPPPGVRLIQAWNFELNFGGAEANVAVSLARFGLDACFLTALPPNELGDNACSALRMHGVDTGFIVRKGQRMGTYYLEHGSGPRPSKVVYDRTHSAFSKISPSDFDWERALEKAQWFHWTGITPALGPSVEEALRRGLKIAKKKGITVSADLNYRQALWKEEKAREVMSGLMPFVDILVGNEEDPTRIFGLRPEETDVEAGKLNIEGYQKLTEELIKRFGFKKVAISLRESISASENFWSACLHDGKNFFQSPRYHVWIVDRVGSGDAFASGLIYSLLKGKTDREALGFAVASACLKHSVYGDFSPFSVGDVERFAAGATTGRVQR